MEELVPKKRIRASKKGFIDFDGSRINPGKSYRSYKALEKLRAQVRRGECPHPAVMVTLRCQCCQITNVILRKSMLKS